MIDKIVTRSYLKRLDNIIQWQERDVFNKESVSQHSFKVSVFTRVLLDDVFGDSHDLQIERFKLDCVTHAIFHDWDEAIFLRDVSHSIKYNEFNGQDVRNAIDEYVNHEFSKEFENLDEQDRVAYETLRKSIVDVDPQVKIVVKVADWLALLFFCRRELALGNKNFEATYKYCKQGLFKAANNLANMAFVYYNINARDFLNSINKLIESNVYGETDF